MSKTRILSVLLLSSTLMACGGSGNKFTGQPSSSVASSSSTTAVSSSSSLDGAIVSSSSSSAASSEQSCTAHSIDFANVRPLSRSVLNAEDTPAPETEEDDAPVYECENHLLFCDDFSAGIAKWQLLPATEYTSVPNGVFDTLDDGDNAVLRYTAASTGGVIALVDPAMFAGVNTADYYVEARIRPRQNGTTGNKQIYLIARYVDGNNWYAGALNVQNANTGTQVEIAKMKDGTLSRPLQVEKPIEQGARDGTDGVWYNLRLQLSGSELTVFLDGEEIGSRSDNDFTQAGLIGLWTANKSFEIDDVKVGLASDKPAQLTISPAIYSYAAEVNDDPWTVTVNSVAPDGSAAEFVAESSNTDVVRIERSGQQLQLVPVGSGTANIRISSLDNRLVRTIQATVAPQFIQPDTQYPGLDCAVFPVPSTPAHVDTRLHITFDLPPVLGMTGAIRIFREADDALVDTIKPDFEKNDITAGTAKRSLNTLPLQVTGNTVTIALHSDVLEYDTTYYVAISESLFAGNSVGGKNFDGIGKAAGWRFTTPVSAPASDTTLLKVGSSLENTDYATVQAALNHFITNLPKATPAVIDLADGVYEELLYINNKDNLTLRGESRDGVIIQYRNSERLNGGSDGRNVFLIANADNITVENLTLRSTTLIGEGGQAETLYFNSQGRFIAKNASFISEQDTIQVKGYSWFYQTLIAGNVDFIWGNNRVALFEESEIRSIGRSSGQQNGGYILQARTVNADDKGFVFLNSQLTRGAGPTGEVFADDTMWLARSAGNAQYFDNIVFVNTAIDSHIKTTGWAATPVANPSVPHAASGWRQYNIRTLEGQPFDTNTWSLGYTLTEAEYEADFSSRGKIFQEWNNGESWNPQP